MPKSNAGRRGRAAAHRKNLPAEFVYRYVVLMSYLSIVIVLAFILLDVVSGLVRAFATTGFDSSVMRQGFFHKLGELLSVALCVVVDVSMPRLGIPVEVDFSAVCCVYLVIMEIGSILENIGAINPELRDPLSKIFAKLKGSESDETK